MSEQNPTNPSTPQNVKPSVLFNFFPWFAFWIFVLALIVVFL